MDSSKDRIEGALDSNKGELKEKIGQFRGNQEQEAEGKSDQAEGAVKHGLADLKNKVDETVKKVTG